jgi:hypothetical protein
MPNPPPFDAKQAEVGYSVRPSKPVTRLTRRAKLAYALALRDAALKVISRMGTWQQAEPARAASSVGYIRLLSARLGTLEISYRTPFQRLPKAADLLKYRAVQQGLTAPQNLPYGLDVWAPKKVMNIEWDDKGNVVLVSLRRGAWETELIVLAKSKELD